MKRIDSCLFAPRASRITVILFAAAAFFVGANAESMAQGFIQSARTEPFGHMLCADLFTSDRTVPIYGGILNLKPPPIDEKSFAPKPPASSPDISSNGVDGLSEGGEKNFAFEAKSSESIDPLPDKSLDSYLDIELPNKHAGFQWGAAITQSLAYLAIAHAWRLAWEPSTRADLKGKFFPEYARSLRNLRGWRDGDEAFVNYLGHPMGGASMGFIQIQNDPKGIRQVVGLKNGEYWKSRLKAFGWSMIWSLQFEIGPFSEASIGNVGLYASKKSNHPMAYVDIVVTPVLGTGWIVGEDLLDRYLIRYIESRTRNRTYIALARSFINPTRAWSNMLRGKWFWYRDDRPRLLD
jgi:hypothetical protein